MDLVYNDTEELVYTITGNMDSNPEYENRVIRMSAQDGNSMSAKKLVFNSSVYQGSKKISKWEAESLQMVGTGEPTVYAGISPKKFSDGTAASKNYFYIFSFARF